MESKNVNNNIRREKAFVYSGRPTEALEQLRISDQKSIKFNDWREIDYMWRKWKRYQIEGDALCWLGMDDLALEKFKEGGKDIIHKTDKEEAASEGFYSDYEFVKNKLKNK